MTRKEACKTFGGSYPSYNFHVFEMRAVISHIGFGASFSFLFIPSLTRNKINHIKFFILFYLFVLFKKKKMKFSQLDF